MKTYLALAAFTCLICPVAAKAKPVSGLYVSLGGGTSILAPVNASFGQSFSTGPETTSSFSVSGKNQFRPSYAGELGIGYGFGNGFRIELDGDLNRYTRHAIDAGLSVTSGGVTKNLGSGHVRATGGLNQYGPMLNFIYDVPTGTLLQPYLGVGGGYQWVKLNSHFVVPLGGPIYTAGTRGYFAYDVIVGASYQIKAVPGLAVTAEYRFMQLTGTDNFKLVAPSGGIPAGINTNVKFGEQSSHTILLGLRYQLFNPPPAPPAVPTPAPAPVAAPAPAPAKTYLVFFDWDKATLTSRATQIIAQAASDSKTQAVTKLDVSGYTDTSGPAAYNMGLSKRRAMAVAAQLVKDGVQASQIEIHAFGETHLLVPTGPNVREPQNRRVEIVLK